MVSIFTLVLFAALAALPAVSLPKTPRRAQPEKVAISPGSAAKCSVPLVNALAGARYPANWGMPVIRPGETGRMPIVQPPAPPCSVWPPK